MKTWAGGLLLISWCASLFWWERKRALRPSVESKLVRDTRNLAIAGASSAVVQIIEMPVALRLARIVEYRKWGLVRRLPLPRSIQIALTVALMDYTLYIWHVLTHRVPVLWRFHQVHHIDRDLDASTAFRFHFAEIILSVPYRAAQVLLIGASPRALRMWQRLLFFSILFHHSNLRLPLKWERRLAHVIVTPRLHGIHHSVLPDEVSSNWSSGLTAWDRLHGTFKTDVPQQSITIGVPGYDAPDEVTLPKMLALPFREAGDVPKAAIVHHNQHVKELRA